MSDPRTASGPAGPRPAGASAGPALRLHRVDARLVHATLLEAWLPHVEACQLVVADAQVAVDSRRRVIIEMSARDVGGVFFVAEQEVAGILASLPDEPTVVVYSSLEGFADALEAGLACERVQVGHIPDGDGRRRVHPSVYVGPQELAQVDRIRARGVEVVVRPLPTDVPRGLRRGEDDRPVLTEDLSPVGGMAVAKPGAMPTSGPQPVLGAPPAEDTPAPAPGAEVRMGPVEVVNERGLHLRAAHVLAQCCGRFASMVQIGRAGRVVNAKSLLGITTLGAARGTVLELRVEGEDADAAYEAVQSLFASGFQEEDAE